MSKTISQLIDEGLVCPSCGAMNFHKHYYPGPVNKNMQHDNNGNYWIWSPPLPSNEQQERTI